MATVLAGVAATAAPPASALVVFVSGGIVGWLANNLLFDEED